MSLTATISTSVSPSVAARKTFLPMRPNPLIPTRTLIRPIPPGRKRPRIYQAAPGRLPRVGRLARVTIGTFTAIAVVLAAGCGGDDAAAPDGAPAPARVVRVVDG